MIRDTFDFVNLISDLRIEKDHSIISFDVSSLFTNVPVTETIEIILDRVFKNKNDLFHNLTRRNLKELLILCVQKSIFQFNGEYYEQIDGVSMGSPLGPLFANVFMDRLENENMEQLKNLGLVFWKRYVDDTFSIIKTDNAQKVLDFLNSIHPNIKFTTELEQNNCIPFLDVLVKKKLGRLHTEMYRKPTFTGTYLNWNSLTSRKYKIGLIKCLLDRTWKICSEPETRILETKRIKSILSRNSYPGPILEKEISSFIKYRAKIDALKNTNPNEYLLGETDVPNQKDICYLKLPYTDPIVEDFSDKLKKLVHFNYPTVSLVVAFSAPTEIGKQFVFKDKNLEIEKQSLVVYHIRCKDCKEDYIGKTARIFWHRLNDHQTSCKGKEDTAIRAHHLKTGHTIDFENARIIDRADSNLKLECKELMHIDKKKPSLNVQHNTQSEFRISVNIIGTKKT